MVLLPLLLLYNQEVSTHKRTLICCVCLFVCWPLLESPGWQWHGNDNGNMKWPFLSAKLRVLNHVLID
uniref:Uncharacterized protein n=1 Tax=Aegilops tauschii subsp. strangulata TaxID=200361 RepID=A0A453RLQ3_AEGTS